MNNSNIGSMLFGVSVRGWLALLLVVTVCVLSGLKIPIEEPLKSLAIAVCAFYFGHQIGGSVANAAKSNFAAQVEAAKTTTPTQS
jgi:hypothetical protein